MRYLFYLSHPSHYHVHKNIISQLKRNGHFVLIIIKTKDILEDLLIQDGIEYKNILFKDRKGSKLSILWSLLRRVIKVSTLIRKHKIDIAIGSDAAVSHAASLNRKFSLIFAEDDAHIIPELAKLMYPFASSILSPVTCNAGKWEYRKIGYHGYQKLAYLHPKRFSFDSSWVSRNGLISTQNIFLIRISKLSAHHDAGIKGFNIDVLKSVVEILKVKGKVIITSEKELPSDFSQYSFSYPQNEVHQLLSAVSLFLGDSQSMAVEAAMLGVPSIRFNDFAGKIGVLEELEHKYHLTFGIKPSEPEKLFTKIDELLAIPNLKEEFQNRRQRMLADKIDVTAFMVWFIENYPESKKIMKENPDYQYNFR